MDGAWCDGAWNDSIGMMANALNVTLYWNDEHCIFSFGMNYEKNTRRFFV